MLPTLNDYNEGGVITPEIWFAQSGMKDKLNEVKDVNKFIITFPYMKKFSEKVESQEHRKIEWYPNLRIFEFENEDIGFFVSSIGASSTAMFLEELIYTGGKYFVLIGGVGVLLEEIKRGEIIIPDGAIREEGTSYHYYPMKKDVKPSGYLSKKLKNICKSMGVNFYTGKVWTTDAPYRETPSRIKMYRNANAICVDMEASACFAVGEYRNVDLAAIFYGGDYVNEKGWNFRKEDMNKSKECEERLFNIVCRALKDVKQ
ncbi:MAG: nucleoside phosphorylase [Candidatus Thermoplasmatota archaeon]